MSRGKGARQSRHTLSLQLPLHCWGAALAYLLGPFILGLNKQALKLDLLILVLISGFVTLGKSFHVSTKTEFSHLYSGETVNQSIWVAIST